MSHILLTKLDRQGNNPEKVLINTESLIYINPDRNTNLWHWAHIETVEGMVCWRVRESSEQVDELIVHDNSITLED